MLSVRGDDKLRAAVLGLKQARRDVRNDIARETRRVMSPVWREAVASHASSRGPATKALVGGARIVAGNPPSAVAATSKRPMRGGLVPVEHWHAIEFGGDRDAVTTYTRRSPNGGTHQVTRHTARQLPPRYRTGRVVYPALKEVVPRLASLWVQIIVRKFNEAAERGE